MNRGRPKTFKDSEALESAMNVFWRTGYHDTSLDDLLKAMEIPRQSLYRSFGDKRTLFLSALDLYGNDVIERIKKILNADQPAINNIDQLFIFWIEVFSMTDKQGCMMHNTSVQSIMTDSDVRTRVSEHQRSVTEELEKALIQAQKENSISQLIDTRAMSRTILTTINGLFGWSRIGLTPEFRNDVMKVLRGMLQ